MTLQVPRRLLWCLRLRRGVAQAAAFAVVSLRRLCRILVHRVKTPCIGVSNKSDVTSTVNVQTTDTPKLRHTRTRLYGVTVDCR